MGNAYMFRMPFGIPGDISRRDALTVETQPYGATAFASYGIPAVISSGTVIPVTNSGLIVYGFLVRPYPLQQNSVSPAAGSGTPLTSGAANILRRGYTIVLVNSGGSSAALGGQVYVYYNTSSAPHVQGGIEGTSGANIQKVPGAAFTSGVDASNFAEIFFDNPGTQTVMS